MNRNPMAGLLGLAQASAVGAPSPLDEQPNEGLVVEAETMDPYAYENPGSVARRDIGLESGREASDHRGMFGTKGTLRDILGLVGDAFLIQSGNDPIYKPRRDQERLSDAMAGFTEGGDAALAAIERVAGVNPAAAQAMQEQYQMNQYRTGQNTTAALRAQTGASDLNRKTLEQARQEASQAIAGALAVGTPEALAYAQEIANQAAQAYNLTPQELGLPAGPLTETQARVLAGRSATTNQNLRLPQQERSVVVQEGNLQERRRSNRVREGQAAEAERGRNARAAEAEAGRERRSLRSNESRGSGSGPRQLRGSEENPSSSLRIRPVGQ